MQVVTRAPSGKSVFSFDDHDVGVTPGASKRAESTTTKAKEDSIRALRKQVAGLQVCVCGCVWLCVSRWASPSSTP